MLSSEENDVLTQVGPGTPMGNLLRQYWMPCMLSSEVDPDGEPRRVLLLGEQLVGFRDTEGHVGLIQNHCPHRGASLFFGRNEEGGLRCVYHGWKFDVSGQCLDMPNEPSESNFRTKVKARAYPCVERGGIVWTYLGPRSTPPPLPDLESNMPPASQEVTPAASTMDCNWVQCIENNLDTSHVAFLHYGSVPAEAGTDRSWAPRIAGWGDDFQYVIGERAPRFVALDTDFGCRYGASRPAGSDTYYWRTTNFMLPFYTMGPVNRLGVGSRIVATIPMDDEHTIQFRMFWEPGSGGRSGSRLLPNTSDWLGRFRFALNGSTDYDIDRQLQRTDQTHRGFTGIGNINDQDRAVTESQGFRADRSIEHLGTSDAMIIRTRRRLLEAARRLSSEGLVPPGVDDPAVYRQRSGWAVVPRGVDVWEATAELRTVTIE
ncbi:MAG: Rieske 2Fe-2S domain-containing protein [Chloroflexi bacterium]|nr:Rieske 2Fe-2S domain-containing protein [Chloroflexota bacterium]